MLNSMLTKFLRERYSMREDVELTLVGFNVDEAIAQAAERLSMI